MPRLFIGSFLTGPEQIRLSNFLARLVPFWPDRVRLQPAEKLHITWLFLGDVAEEKVQEIKDRLIALAPQLQGEEISCLYQKVECWPDQANARVVVLTPEDSPQTRRILALGEMLRESLAGYCQKQTEYIFRPHLTIIRLKPHSDLGDNFWQAIKKYDQIAPVKHNISKIELVQSHLGQGSSYQSCFAIEKDSA